MRGLRAIQLCLFSLNVTSDLMCILEKNILIFWSTLQSAIIGKRLRENALVARGKLQREIRVPISNNFARLSILCEKF